MTVQTWQSSWYSSYNERAALLGSIQATATQGQFWREQSYNPDPTGERDEEYQSVWLGQGNDDRQVCLFSDPCGGVGLGCMDIRTDAVYPTSSRPCGILGAVTDAIWNFIPPKGGIIAAVAAAVCL